MLDASGRISHVQLHQCETAHDALCLAEAALIDSLKAVGIEIWQGTTRVACVSTHGARPPAMA
jgi:hypothetical protein